MTWKYTKDVNFEIEHHMKNGLTKKEAEFLVNDITAKNQNGSEYGRALLKKSLKNDSGNFDLPDNNKISIDDIVKSDDAYFTERGSPHPGDKYIETIKKQRLDNYKKFKLLDDIKQEKQSHIDGKKNATTSESKIINIGVPNGPIGPQAAELALMIAAEKALSVPSLNEGEDAIMERLNALQKKKYLERMAK